MLQPSFLQCFFSHFLLFLSPVVLCSCYSATSRILILYFLSFHSSFCFTIQSFLPSFFPSFLQFFHHAFLSSFLSSFNPSFPFILISCPLFIPPCTLSILSSFLTSFHPPFPFILTYWAPFSLFPILFFRLYMPLPIYFFCFPIFTLNFRSIVLCKSYNSY